jgi:MoxR-like ATPase
LPESQRDRFFIRLSIGYPSHEDERRIIERQLTTMSVEQLEPVATAADVLNLQAVSRRVKMEDSILEYVLAIVEMTRKRNDLAFGASPRGALMLATGARSLALIEGRDYCMPDDVKRLVKPILLHRLVHRSDTQSTSERAAAEALDEILHDVPVPV